MNVGIAVHNYDRSEGTGGYVVELLTRITEHHEVTLYAARVGAPVPDGVKFVHVPAIMTRAYTAILTFPAALRLRRKKHHVMHAQGWVTASADVVTAHIVMAAWRQAAKSAGVKSPPGEHYLGNFVQSREAVLLGNNARHVIAPSQKVQQEVTLHYGRTKPISVIPHGFPLALERSDIEVARRELGLPSATMALFVGDSRKGLTVAVEAVAAVPGVHLAIVSRSSPASALSIAEELGAADRIHWLGERRDPSTAYAAADMLLHPTIYDSFGLVVAEAMAHGLPSVVTTAAGICELIEHGESGWLVDGNPVEGTTRAVEALASDKAARERIGKAAQMVARSRSWDVVADETLAVYEQVARR